jgi:hypothetical protein
MATEALKSNPIINLDAFPVVTNTSGEGGDAPLRTVNGHVAAAAGVTSGSTYRLCRFPTNSKIKHVLLTAAGQGATGTVDINVAHSDNPMDGTPATLAGQIVQLAGPVDNKLFGSAVAITTVQRNLDQTFANGFTTDHMNLPLWQVLVNLGATQFTSDPGGFFDIVLKSVATLANGGDLSVEVQYAL